VEFLLDIIVRIHNKQGNSLEIKVIIESLKTCGLRLLTDEYEKYKKRLNQNS